MRACHGMHATDQQGFKLVKRSDGAPREADQRLHNGERVPDTMTKFTNEELPMRFRVSKPQQSAYRGDEISSSHRFGQIGVGALVQGNLPWLQRQRGRLQHQQAGVLVLHDPTKLQPRHVGELSVDYGKFDWICLDRSYGGGPACGRMHAIAQCGKLTRFMMTARLIAIDDQYGHALFPS